MPANPVTESTPEMPWPISNAIACLKEVRDREQDGSERAETIRLAMEYAIETVKGINSLRPPQPPDPAREAQKAVRAFCRDLGEAFRSLADGFERIADGEPRWEDDR